MKKTILSCLLALGFLTASAQDQQPKTEYVFNPHWYVQIQPLGIQHTLGEVDFGDLNSYNVQAAVGRQFSPIFGGRLAVNAWQSKGGSEFTNGQKYTWSWKYVAPSVDLTLNLSNALCGFNPNRVFNFGIFGGIGVNIGFSNDEAWTQKAAIDKAFGLSNLTNDAQCMGNIWDGTKVRLFGQAGITGDFKVNDKISIGLELSANTLNDSYNSKPAGNWDWYFNALAGVKINLGETYTTREIPVPEPEIRYVEKIVEKIVEKPAPAPAATVAQVEPLRRDIFFLINKTNIRPSEAQKVKDIADYLNEHPTAKVVVTGYADAGTGNNKINDRLAAGRADSVVKSLKKDYGIAESRISYDSKGSRVQPFAENDMNRVSICIAE